jgi:hypothetical protein
MNNNNRSSSLGRHLFVDGESRVFTVLDGASIPGLLKKLRELKPAYVCLYRGDLAPDLAECAPYLVQLEPRREFTRWVLSEGWGRHWGIFAETTGDLKDLRKHFRTFLRVRGSDGKVLYFRYYDPRVLRTYLPTCNQVETGLVFGPVRRFLCEDEAPESLLVFRVADGLPRRESVKLNTG